MTSLDDLIVYDDGTIGKSSFSDLPVISHAISAVNKVARAIHIAVADNLIPIFRYMIPSLVNWNYQLYVAKTITCYKLELTAGKTNAVAYLYLQSKPNEKYEEGETLLFSHGDYGHPFNLMNLSNEAAKNYKRGPVYSLHIPGIHKNENYENHKELFKLAIDKIESLARSHNSPFNGVKCVMHSMSAIIAADRHFVDLDPRIKGLFSIGGRLKVDESCDKRLIPIINKINQGVKAHPERYLFPVGGKKDWIVPFDMIMVRPGLELPDAMHLNTLFAKETKVELIKFCYR